MFESLESRSLFSGVVTVTTNYGPDHRLLIQGDDAVNEVTLFAGFANTYEEGVPYQLLYVYGSRLIIDGEVTVEDPSNPGTFVEPYGRNPLIDLGGGDDALLLDGDIAASFGDVDIRTGNGNDRITADSGFEALSIDSGNGNDRVTVRSRLAQYFGLGSYGISGVLGDLDIATGQGKDRIALVGDDPYYPDPFRIGGRLRIGDNSGPTQVSIANVRVRRAATIALNRFNDTVTVANSVFGGETRFLTGAGNDFVRFRGKVIVPNIATALLLGPGGDKFDADRYYDDLVG